MQATVRQVLINDAVADYLLAIVERTRRHESLELGVSPRGSQALYRAAQALAYLEGRTYAIPDDVKRLAVAVCGHRCVLRARASLNGARSLQGDAVMREILDSVEVPL